MRDILFKAKQIDTGEWVEGDLIHYESGEVAILEQPFSKYGYEATEISGRTMVDPNTICQYTGLTDKNGNKIWEGDLLSCKMNVVEYCNGEFTISGDRPLNLLNKEFEVIGNIFDNAELLEGQV